MKYCFACGNITAGQPLFCNSCGRSYDVKLCPRRHVNPRTAEACSQCGSRDLSMPQPKRPWWAPFFQFALSLIPGALLALVTILAVLVAIQALLRNPQIMVSLFFLMIPFAILWWMWSQIPKGFRTWLYRLLKRRRERGDEGKG